MIYIISSKKADALGLDSKAVWVKVLPKLPASFKAKADDHVYLDISGLSADEIKKTTVLLKKRCAGSFQGALDSKGSIKGKKSQKLPAVKFEGWKSVKSGVSAPFFFLYAAILGRSDLNAIVGDTSFNVIKKRFCEVLSQYLKDADALLWMEKEDHCLFLVPPKSANGKAAVEAALKFLMNSRLISVEKLGLSFPLEFTFALHYGTSIFHSPGKTGSVISESINYIFHLGEKKAEAGRLTVSGDTSDEVFPDGIIELFGPAGDFEGIPIKHSRRFKLINT